MSIKGGGFVLAIGLAVALGAMPLEAQRGPGFRGAAAGPFAGQSLDVLLDNREAIGLESEQLSRLNELKVVMDGEIKPLAEEMRTLRDQIRNGDVDRAEGLRQLQAVRGRLLTAAAPLRGRVQEILTVEQHRKLQAIVWQNRPGGVNRGRPAAGRGGAPGFGRGGAWDGRRPGFQGRPGGQGYNSFRGGQRGVAPGRGGMPGPAFRRGGGMGLWFAPEVEPAPPAPGGEVDGRG